MRLVVNKTYKMLIGGSFVRSESNRSFESSLGGGPTVNTPRATRKDVRDAVKAARTSLAGWSGRTSYNRGQILYRLAEMLEARRDEFGALSDKRSNMQEVDCATDRLLYYAGWCDKYQQVLGSVNPVAAPYFNFSFPEPVGVVGAACGQGLLGIVSLMAPIIAGGNAVVLLAEDASAVVACEFAEVVATSDVPPGVVSILTGKQSETIPTLAKHMDVNSLAVSGVQDQVFNVVDDATENLKRLKFYGDIDWFNDNLGQGLSLIEDFQEIKTVWHPIGI